MKRLLALAVLTLALLTPAARVPAADGERAWPGGSAAMSAMTPGLLRTAEDSVFFLALVEPLALTDAQHAALQEIAYEFQKQQLQRLADMKVAEAELERLLTRDAIDLDAVKAKVGESAGIAAAMKIVQIESLLRAVKVLTHEQHVKVLLLRRAPREPAS